MWFWEWFDKFALILTFVMIVYLFVKDPRTFIREWILTPLFGKTMPDPAEHGDAVAEAEANDDPAMIDAAARVLAAGLAGEAAIIEAVFGVPRGGSARYRALRDQVRNAASAHGWRQAAKPAPTLRVTRDGKAYEILRNEEDA